MNTERPIDVTDILAQPREFAQRLARVERERAELIETVARLRAECNDAQAVARAYILRAERAEADVERLTAALTDCHVYLTGKKSVSDPVRLVADIHNLILRQPAPAQECRECGHHESEHMKVGSKFAIVACSRMGCDCVKPAPAQGQE